jgi:hypothetical protein
MSGIGLACSEMIRCSEAVIHRCRQLARTSGCFQKHCGLWWRSAQVVPLSRREIVCAEHVNGHVSVSSVATNTDAN